jgi:hypothetical protein
MASSSVWVSRTLVAPSSGAPRSPASGDALEPCLQDASANTRIAIDAQANGRRGIDMAGLRASTAVDHGSRLLSRIGGSW